MAHEGSNTALTMRHVSFGSYLSQGYWRVFGQQWPVWLGGVLLGVANFALFAYASVWFIYGGFSLSGAWLISWVGIEPATKLVEPWLNTGWVHDAAIIVGAFISCLLASDFRIRMPARLIRLVDGFGGGLLMGVGVMLAPGCNIGGYFSAIAALSLSGFVIFFGLAGGAYTGVLLARWRLRRELASGILRARQRQASPAISPTAVGSRWRQPVIGLLVFLAAIGVFELFMAQERTNLGMFMLFGLAFGFILQRAGFCFTASFRDLFTSGDGRLARGVIIAIAVAMLGFSILQGLGIRQPFVLAVGWHTLVGGYLFGLGMVLAGGCATGTLFRIGEGSVQLLFALFGGMLGAALTGVFLRAIQFQSGPRVWLVDSLGWQGALLAGLAFLGMFLLIVQWNEMRRRVVR